MKKNTVQVRLDQDDIKKLSGVAKEQGHTLSSLLRFVVKMFLKSKGKL